MAENEKEIEEVTEEVKVTVASKKQRNKEEVVRELKELFEIVKPANTEFGFPFFTIKRDGQGRLPDPLTGMFTTKFEAEKAINTYAENMKKNVG